MTTLLILRTAFALDLAVLAGFAAHLLGRAQPALAPRAEIDEQLAVLVVPGAQPLVVTAWLAVDA